MQFLWSIIPRIFHGLFHGWYNSYEIIFLGLSNFFMYIIHWIMHEWPMTNVIEVKKVDMTSYLQIFSKLKMNGFVWCLEELYGVRHLEMSIRFSLKSRPSEWFHWREMSQIKAQISLHTNLKLIFHKNVGWQGYQWIPWFL